MRLSYGPGQRFYPDDWILNCQDVVLEGDGPGITELVISPGAAIKIMQRDFIGSSLVIRNLSIVLDGEEDTAMPPLQIEGPGTENLGQQMVRLQNVQFGYRDVRPTEHPNNPGERQALPESWVKLTGVYGSVFDHCHFSGQWRGGRHDSWASYPVKNAVLFASGPDITDIDGTTYPPRTMRNELRSCYFSPGIGNCVFVGPACWVEGITLDKCHATDVWRLLHLSTDRANKGKGTSVTVRDCDVAFNCEAVRLDTGAGIRILGNYFLPLPNGDFQNELEISSYVALGRAVNYGPIMTLVVGNIFGMTHPTNKPDYAVLADEGTSRLKLEGNFYQACESVYCGDHAEEIYVDGELVQ